MKRNKIIMGSLVLALILAGIWVFIGPSRDECKAAVNQIAMASINDEPVLEAQATQQLRWPCRFQSQAQKEAIATEVMSGLWPLAMAKGMSDAFKGEGS